MSARFSLVSIAAICFAALFAPATAASCTNPQGAANIDIVDFSETLVIIEFTDATGNTSFVNFARETEDDIWMPTSNVSTTRGIVFGRPDPQLPRIAQLRDRDIEPNDVPVLFSLEIADEVFDNLTIYQFSAKQIAVALEVDGLVTRIYFAGPFMEKTLAAVGVGIVDWCNVFKNSCCKTTSVEQGENGENGDTIDLPDPILESCWAAHEACTIEGDINEICDCLMAACKCAQPDDPTFNDWCYENENNHQACIDACLMCDPNCPLNDDDEDEDAIVDELLELLRLMIDLLAV